jgi:hypothetical protein
VNTYGVWQFSNWALLAEQLRNGFDYGKQRCTAYVRFIVQRELFPQFLEMYLPVLRSLRFGNPVLVRLHPTPRRSLAQGFRHRRLIGSFRCALPRSIISSMTWAKGVRP